MVKLGKVDFYVWHRPDFTGHYYMNSIGLEVVVVASLLFEHIRFQAKPKLFAITCMNIPNNIGLEVVIVASLSLYFTKPKLCAELPITNRQE